MHIILGLIALALVCVGVYNADKRMSKWLTDERRDL